MKVLVKNLSLGHEDIILRDLNFEFSRDGIFSIIGPSGAGKTSLIYALAGLLKPLSGEIINLPPSISVLFQEDRLFYKFTVAENIRAFKDNLSYSEIREALEALGLGDIINRKIGQLSGGMKRRVAIARTMLADSDLILMDEAFTGIDEKNKSRTLDFIKEKKGDRGIVFFSHSPIGIEDSYISL